MEKNDNLISRSTYKYIKSLNRVEMSKYLISLEEETVREYGVNLDELRQVIGSVSGIGEKRLNEIMDAISEHYNLKKEDTESEDS